jgi:hypothetical protein
VQCADGSCADTQEQCLVTYKCVLVRTETHPPAVPGTGASRRPTASTTACASSTRTASRVTSRGATRRRRTHTQPVSAVPPVLSASSPRT